VTTESGAPKRNGANQMQTLIDVLEVVSLILAILCSLKELGWI
jgi:hypothetical protein